MAGGRPGLAPDHVAATVTVQRRRDPVGAGVLPDDRVVVRPAGALVPHQRGLALVGDSQRRQVGGGQIRRVQRRHDHRRGAFPDLDGIVLDPARLRQDLFVLELVTPDLGAVVVEDHAAGAGGALVDCGDEVGQLDCSSSMADPIDHDGLHGFFAIVDIDRMPRGGPDASCLDRLLQTDRREYLDRDDVDDRRQAQRGPRAGVDRRVLRQPREVRTHRARRGGRRARSQDPGARLGPRRAVAQAAGVASHRRAHGHRHRADIGGRDRGRRSR